MLCWELGSVVLRRSVRRNGQLGTTNVIQSVLNGCAAGDKESGCDAQDGDHAGEDPGAFLKYVCGLFHTHELVAETGNVSCQATTFWILHQNNKA